MNSNLNLFRSLRSLQVEIGKEIECVNDGGCCVFASIVGDHLQSQNIKSTAVVGSCDGFDHFNVEDQRPMKFFTGSVNRWNRLGVHFHHVWLEIEIPETNDLFFFDSQCLLKADNERIFNTEYFPQKGRISLDIIRKLRNSHSGLGWNTCFSRAQIPKMKKIIKECLKSI